MEHDTGAPAGRDPDATVSGAGSDVISGGGRTRSDGLPRWALGVVGGALVLVVAGGAAAWAAATGGGGGGPGASLAAAPAPTTTPTPTTTPAPGQRELRDGPGGPGGPGRPGADGLRGALHGRVTVPDRAAGGSGTGYREVLVQRGTVTGVSATSLTLRSADGFTATYRLTAQTRFEGTATSAAGLRTGLALAVVAGTDSAALQVRDVLPPMIGRHDHRGLLGPEGGPAPSGAPATPGATTPGATTPGATTPGGTGSGTGSGSGGADPGGADSGGADSGGAAPARPSGHLPMSAPGAGPPGGAAT